MSNIRKDILDSICKIYDKHSNKEVIIYDKQLKFYASKYSSKKTDIWQIEINGIRIKKTSDLIISYKCLNCNTVNSVSSTQFIRKINKCSVKCPICFIKDLDKSTMSKKTLREIYENSLLEFESYPDDFKQSYMASHLSIENYNKIKSNILGFCNSNRNKMDDYEFWSIYRTNNQQKFTSVLYDKVNDTIFKADQPILKCTNCLKTWRAKNIEQFKNTYKIMCKDCKLCNKTFKIRSTKNIMGETIIYQSKLELKFINWCESNQIILHNGPNINYFFNDKSHTYRVDFKIDDILIEIKDYHIWHKNQIESGKWDAKMKGIEEYIKNTTDVIKFILLTPSNWNQMLRELLIKYKKLDSQSKNGISLEN